MECPHQLFCVCGADLGGGEKIQDDSLDRQKEKAVKSITPEYNFVWKQQILFIPGHPRLGRPANVRGGISWEGWARKKAQKHLKRAWKKGYLD
eukprot:12412821-Karenia_brevis.AAC.1